MAEATFDGNFIREKRKALSMTQRQFAEAVGVTESMVSRWESGRITPSPLARKAIQNIQGKTVEKSEAMVSLDSVATFTGKAIRQLRVRCGLTQAELASNLGVTVGTINRWENDRSLHSNLARDRLAHVFSALLPPKDLIPSP